MPDQDWKDGGLNRDKYVIFKRCELCRGTGVLFGSSTSCATCGASGRLPIYKDAAYFPLRIDCDSETGEPYDPNARDALAFYAIKVETINPQLASDIRQWLEETGEQFPRVKS